jgi:radical SAM superfamily enzyme YgiQ (UPF0313 family)
MPDKDRKALRNEALIRDLDSLPSPYLSGVFDLSSTRSVELVISRGCSNKCSYCAINESPLRYFSYARIKKELAHILARAPRLESVLVTVADMYENDALAGRLLPLFRRAAEARKIRFFFYVNVASLRKDRLLRLSDCSFFDIEVGIQSIRPEALRLCRRIPDPELIKSNIERFKRLAPSANKALGLISFLPGDGEAGYLDSLEWAVSTGLEVGVNHLRVIPGTELHRTCERLGYKVSPEYPYFITRTPDLPPARIKEMRALTTRVFFSLKAMAFSAPLRETFFRDAAALPVRRPHVFLAGALAAYWAKDPATAALFRCYEKNVKASGSLDHNMQIGHFRPADTARLGRGYREFMARLGEKLAVPRG